MEKVRSFAIVVVDDFDNEVDRFNLDYAETPKNLGFEIDFTTLESQLTTHFTSAHAKKIPTTVNINFLPPNAYVKANAFRRFVQTHTKDHMLFEYDDTIEVKYWEGKIQKLDQEELTDWGGLVCPMQFLPGTPKYLRKDSSIYIRRPTFGKSYPYRYPYTYGSPSTEGVFLENTYFDRVPLRIALYGELTDPQVSLQDTATGEVYATVRIEGLFIAEDEHLVVDAIRSKILLYRGGKYISAYDHVYRSEGYSSFLSARENCTSKIIFNMSSSDTGYLKASYRQYIL